MRTTKLCLFLASISVLAISIGGRAQAQTNTSNLDVRVSVIKACTIGTTAVAFSAYDPTASTANNTGQGTVTITCTPGTAPTVALGLGGHLSGTDQRNMANPAGDRLPYGLFQDPGRLTRWGDGTTGGSVNTPIPATIANNSPVVFQVFGQIPALQSVPEATYTDQVLATVNF